MFHHTYANGSTCNPHDAVQLDGDSYYGYVYIALAAVTILTNILIPLTHFLCGEPFVVRHIVSMIALCDVVQGVAMIIEATRSNDWYKDELTPTTFCVVNSAVFAACRLASLFWTVALMVTIYLVVAGISLMSYYRRLLIMHALVWGLSIGLMFSEVFFRGMVPQNNYAMSGGCTPIIDFRIDKHGNCVPSKASFIWLMAVFYGWTIVSVLVVIVLFLLIITKSYLKLRSLAIEEEQFHMDPARGASTYSSSINSDREEASTIFHTNLKLALIAFLYTVTWIPGWATIIYAYVHGPADPTPFTYVYTYVYRVGPFIQALGNFVIYAVLSPAFAESLRMLLSSPAGRLSVRHRMSTKAPPSASVMETIDLND